MDFLEGPAGLHRRTTHDLVTDDDDDDALTSHHRYKLPTMVVKSVEFRLRVVLSSSLK